jgi:hypothetical protein
LVAESDLQAHPGAGRAIRRAGLAGWESEHSHTDESFRLALQRAALAAWMRDKIIADVPLTAEQVHIRT